MNFRLVVRLLGLLALLVALSMASSLIWAWLDEDVRSLRAFGLSVGVSALVGASLMFAGRGCGRQTLGQREGLLVVSGSWVLAGLLGALPFIFSGAVPGPADAIFESVSGFSTTGASILSSIETLPRALLFWRSLIQWLGGMGIVVLFVAVLPGLGMGGRFLYRQEAPGPAKAGLRPHVRDTASMLWKIYLGLTLAEIILLFSAGMDFFDSICHTLTTMATGGYSTRNASIAAYGSLHIEMVILVFMFAAGVNFALYANLWRGSSGKGLTGMRSAFKDAEFRVYVGLLLGAIIVITGALIVQADVAPARALRDASFQAVAMQTTTGFATADFDGWPPVARLILVALMFVGGCAGSTGGSAKVVRFMVMAKLGALQVRRFFRPRRVALVRVSGEVVDDEMQEAIAGFFVLFVATWMLVSLVLAFLGHDIITATTASIACLGNIGPGLAAVGPVKNFGWMGDFEKLFLSAVMIVGRLEMYTVLGLFSRSFWRA